MARIVIVYHSGYGHTKVQAEYVLKGLQLVDGVESSIITADEAMKDFTPLNEADCIIFGCPTYMGGPSSVFKAFAEAASKIWAKEGWKDKLAAGFTNSSGPSGDKLFTLNYLFINAMQHGMVWVGLGLLQGAENTLGTDEEVNRLVSFAGAMSQSPHGSKEPLKPDLKTAEVFGKRVGETALRWVRGKSR